ncbi:hypothetical protein BELL_0860g00030 [Botrytis elliptica]|uniref:Uncharacterized protein n=1 Tax=Botrytis elliptica TaxID=278938 RepID=A0A4Z1JG61_9HELO|nr:hypothetical protein BELL_0860g00030 [Botrytis elliptica]
MPCDVVPIFTEDLRSVPSAPLRKPLEVLTNEQNIVLLKNSVLISADKHHQIIPYNTSNTIMAPTDLSSYLSKSNRELPYLNFREFIEALKKDDDIVEIDNEIDPYL